MKNEKNKIHRRKCKCIQAYGNEKKSFYIYLMSASTTMPVLQHRRVIKRTTSTSWLFLSFYHMGHMGQVIIVSGKYLTSQRHHTGSFPAYENLKCYIYMYDTYYIYICTYIFYIAYTYIKQHTKDNTT